MAYKGKYTVRFPQKYKGDPTKVTYRSGLELKFMRYCELHRDVLEWSSEEVVVQYRSPLDNKVHRYFTDFYVKRRLPDGSVIENIIEVKPLSQCQPPKGTRRTRRLLVETQTWAVNLAKWKAAKQYAEARGWKFIVLTDREINGLS
jgi:hypothetical protein